MELHDGLDYFFSTFPWNLGSYQLMGCYRHHSLVIVWLNWPQSLTSWNQTLSFFLWNICSQAKCDFTSKICSKKNHWCLLALCVTKRPLKGGSEVDSRVRVCGFEFSIFPLWLWDIWQKYIFPLSFCFFSCKMKLKDETTCFIGLWDKMRGYM